MNEFKKKCLTVYENGHPTLTDDEFDKTFGDTHKELGVKGKAKLPYWMGSLDKVRTQRSLNLWLRGVTKPLVAAAKIDGVSALYHNGKLYTRGNGEYGTDISKVLNYISLPRVDYTVRGELVMTTSAFQKYSHSSKNARNMVAGLLNRKEETRELLQDINFYSYEIVGLEMSPSEQYLKLQLDGFTVAAHEVTSSGKTFHELYDIIQDKNLDVGTDGVVLYVDTPYINAEKGNPKYAVALKKDLDVDTRIVQVKEVKWNTSKWAALKPVIVINPVELKGVVIHKTSGFNARYIFNNKINTGAILRIKRSGGVIPTIVDVLQPSTIPLQLPYENYTWHGVDIIVCEDTRGETIKKLLSTVSHVGLRNLSTATVTKLYDAGLTTLHDIIFANVDTLRHAGIGEKMAVKLITAINASFFEEGVSIVKLLGGSGLLGYGLGENIVQKLFISIPKFMRRKSLSLGDVMAVSGMGPVRAKMVVEYYPEAMAHIGSLLKSGVHIVFPNSQTVESPEEKIPKYVFSGFRDSDLEVRLDVYSSVSGKTDYLVVKSHDMNSAKIEKAKKLGVEIIALDELKTKLNLSSAKGK